jgi:hypothetical protein
MAGADNNFPLATRQKIRRARQTSKEAVSAYR